MWAPTTAGAIMPALHWVSLVSLFLFVVAPTGRPLSFSVVATAAGAGAILAGGLGMLDWAGVTALSKIWDPPGVAGAFDSREFALGYYAAVIPLLAAAAVRTSGSARVVAAAGGLLAAAHFGLTAEADFLMIWGITLVVVTLGIGLLQGFARLPLLFGAFGALTIAGLLALGLSLAAPNPGAATDATALPWLDAGRAERSVETAEIRDDRFSIRRIEEANGWRARNYALGVAFDLFREEPVIGHGPGGWWAMQTKYVRVDDPLIKKMFARWPAFRSPHSGLALVMVELGAIGLFLLLAWFSTILGMTITALAQKQEPENWLIEHWGLATALVVGGVFAVFTPALQGAPAATLLFVVAALLTRESAALNGFSGLSEIWTINREGRRIDTGIFAGVLPVALGAVAVVAAGWFAAAEFYRSWGDLMMLRTRHEMAVTAYEEAEDLWGGDGDVLYNHALALRRLGKSAEATDIVNKAALLRPFDVRIVNLLSGLHLAKQDYDEAVKASRRAVEIYPNYIEGRRNLAAALDLQGRASDAAKELIAILELDPPDGMKGRVHRDLGGYYEGPLSNPAKALEHYELALPLLTDKFLIDDVKPRVEELKKEIERTRLMREGKPIPRELMPGGDAKNAMPGQPGHDGHGH